MWKCVDSVSLQEHGMLYGMETVSPHNQNTAQEQVHRKKFLKTEYTNITGMEDTLEEFRQYYLGERQIGREDSALIFREFRKQKEIEGIHFNPYPNYLKQLYKRFDKELPPYLQKYQSAKDVAKNNRENRVALGQIQYEELENRSKSLHSLLLDEAEELINESKLSFEDYLEAHPDEMWSAKDLKKHQMEQKKLALGVAERVSAVVQKNSVIKLKKNKEGRETAGFLMDLMKKATTGELTEEEMQLLENSSQH